LFERSNGFPKNINIFTQMVGSRNTSSGWRVFASSSKQGGISKIKRKNLNTGNIQKRQAIF
jgi:hypothetical protein